MNCSELQERCTCTDTLITETLLREYSRANHLTDNGAIISKLTRFFFTSVSFDRRLRNPADVTVVARELGIVLKSCCYDDLHDVFTGDIDWNKSTIVNVLCQLVSSRSEHSDVW